jgi:hypothetical protein
MFFEENSNFKIPCYLRHCGVIPVQIFGSHICPSAIRIRVQRLSTIISVYSTEILKGQLKE